jgi:hypothetical protein
MSKLYKTFTNEELMSNQELWFKGYYLADKAGRPDKMKVFDKMIQDISDELARRNKETTIEEMKNEFARQCQEVGSKRIKLHSIGGVEVSDE